MLRLRARAWPAGAAEVTLRLNPVGTDTEVTIEEQADLRPGGAACRGSSQDPPLAWRNVETLRRLAYIAERRAAVTHDAVVVGAGPERAGRREPAGRPRLVGARPRGPARRRRRRRAAPRTCTPASCTTRSARSTRWPRRRPRSGRSRLEEHGLRWRHAPAVLGHPLPGRRLGAAAPRPRVTAAGLDEHAPRRRRGVARLCAGLGPDRRRPDRRAADARSRRSAPALGLLGPAARASAGSASSGRCSRPPPSSRGAGSAAGRRGSCWPATPATPTSRSTPPAPA